MHRNHYPPLLGRAIFCNPEIGVRWLHRALKLDPDHQLSHQALYDYYQRTGDLDKAEQQRLQLR